MGNCQGKKATNVATPAERSLDVNTPIVVEPETQPTTPEKIVEAASIAKSFSKDDTATVTQVASHDASVITTGGETAISIAASTGEMTRSSTAKSVVNTAPSTDTANVTADVTADVTPTDQPEMYVNSILQTMPTEVTEVGKKKSFLDKVDGFYDTLCGAEVGGAVESNPYVAVDNSSSESQTASTVASVTPVENAEASSSAGFSRAASTASSVVSSNDPNYKQKRKLNKKLREIEALEVKDSESLTIDQKEKLETKDEVLQSLAAF